MIRRSRLSDNRAPNSDFARSSVSPTRPYRAKGIESGGRAAFWENISRQGDQGPVTGSVDAKGTAGMEIPSAMSSGSQVGQKCSAGNVVKGCGAIGLGTRS
jgi:hypothetical protein